MYGGVTSKIWSINPSILQIPIAVATTRDLSEKGGAWLAGLANHARIGVPINVATTIVWSVPMDNTWYRVRSESPSPEGKFDRQRSHNNAQGCAGGGVGAGIDAVNNKLAKSVLIKIIPLLTHKFRNHTRIHSVLNHTDNSCIPEQLATSF